MKTKQDIINEINEETAQQIWKAGHTIDMLDAGWAFDRAIRALSLNSIVDKWTEEDWQLHADSWDSFVENKK